MHVIITSPSLDPTQNVSGISAVTQFIMASNTGADYIHFEQGRRDGERGGLFRLLALLRALRRWRRLLRAYPQALIHYNFPLSDLSIIRDSLFLRLAGTRPTVVHIHGGNYLMSASTPLPIRWLLRRLFAKDIPFIVLSRLEQEQLQRQYHPRHIYVLPNCPDLTHARSFVRQPNTHSPLTLGYLGRICRDKGMPELLQACDELLRRGIDFRLAMAGTEDRPEFLPLFQSRLGEHFHYCGVVTGAEKSALLQSWDIFVLPSYYEGLPMSLLESMSYGVVPVCTSVGSIGEVVIDGTNGLLVAVHSVADIVTQVLRLHDDRSLLASLSEGAAQTILDHFHPDSYIQELNHIYASQP